MILINPHRFSAAIPYTWNPLDKASNIVLSQSDRHVGTNTDVIGGVRATYSASTGKRYFEIQAIKPFYGSLYVGVGNASANLLSNLGNDANSWGFSVAGDIVANSGTFVGTYGSPQGYSPNFNDIVGVLADFDNGRLSFTTKSAADSLIQTYKVSHTNLAGVLFPMVSTRWINDNESKANFTRDTWVIAPPIDFVAWNESPHSGTTGYAKFNSADKSSAVDIIGDYSATRNTNSPSWASLRMTGGASTGKKYFEFVYTGDLGSSGYTIVGFGTAAADLSNYCGSDALGYGYQPTQGRLWQNNVTRATYPQYAAPGTVIGIAVDLDGQTFDVYHNGVLQTPVSGSNSTSNVSGTVYVMASTNYKGAVHLRIKPTDWTQTPPVGYSAWTA